MLRLMTLLCMLAVPAYAETLENMREATHKQSEFTTETIDARQQFIKSMESQHESYVKGLLQGAKGATEAMGGVATDAEQRIKQIGSGGSAAFRNRFRDSAASGTRSRKASASRPYSRSYRNTPTYSERFGSGVEEYNQKVNQDLSKARSRYTVPQRQSYSDTYGNDVRSFRQNTPVQRPAGAGSRSLME